MELRKVAYYANDIPIPVYVPIHIISRAFHTGTQY